MSIPINLTPTVSKREGVKISAIVKNSTTFNLSVTQY
jgi:hypothetical protein